MIEEFNIPGTCLSRCEMTNVIVMENSDGHSSIHLYYFLQLLVLKFTAAGFELMLKSVEKKVHSFHWSGLFQLSLDTDHNLI